MKGSKISRFISLVIATVMTFTPISVNVYAINESSVNIEEHTENVNNEGGESTSIDVSKDDKQTDYGTSSNTTHDLELNDGISGDKQLDNGEKTSEVEDAETNENVEPSKESEEKEELTVGDEEYKEITDSELQKEDQYDAEESDNEEKIGNEETEDKEDYKSEENKDETTEELTEDEIEEKKLLKEELVDLEKCEEGEDYVEDELIFLCDTKENAEVIAQEYSEATESNIVLSDFEYGVATLLIKDENLTVEDIVSLAADTDNSLVAVYPNYYEELCTVNTINEDFTDPLTKTNEDGEYNDRFQYFHELIGSKYVWNAIEKNEIPSPEPSKYETFKDALSDTVVAVIDTGINVNGYDFYEADASGEKSNVTPIFVGGMCFATDGNPSKEYADIKDMNGHGSNVAGIIADTANDFGGRGIASGVKIMPIKVMKNDGTGSTSWTMKALAYATEARKKYDEDPNQEGAYNVKVINLSLGSYRRITIYEALVTAAREQGITVCCAAGNYDNSAPYYPASYNGAISVASVNSLLEKSEFSNYGSKVDVCAPGGEDRTSYNYDKSEFNVSDYQYELEERIYASGKNGESAIDYMYGTSQAAPMVSAVAALVMTRYPNMTPAEVEARIKSTAMKTKSSNIGAGCINVPAALGMADYSDSPEFSLPENTDIGTENYVKLSVDNDDALIYYTLNGKTPDPSNMEETGTKIYDETIINSEEMTSDGIHLVYDGVNSSITVKAVSLLYGKLSSVASAKYLFADKAVREINISQKNNINTIMTGKTLNLITSVLPTYAANKKLIWTSSDTSIATVSSKGVVTAKAPCEVDRESNKLIPVRITATAADGYGAYGTFDVYVMAKTQKVEIITDKTTEVLEAGDSFIFSTIDDEDNGIQKNVNIWPENALQEVTYKSSNSKIVKVSADGVVTAVGSGTATVTVTAADGSGKKDSLKFKVNTPITSISIRDKNTSVTKDMLSAGCKLTPVVSFNEGKSKPDNTTLKWSLVEPFDAADYVTINTKNGVVTAKSNAAIGVAPVTITIRATSEEYGIYGEYTFEVYQKTTGISIDKDKLEENYGSDGVFMVKNTMYIPMRNKVYLRDIINILPSEDEPGRKGLGLDTMRMFSIKSSNNVVASVPGYSDDYSKYFISANSNGKSTITLKALDGSDKTLKFEVVVVNEKIDNVNFKNGLKCTNGNPVYYPGKKLKFEMDNTHSYKITKQEWEMYDINEKDYSDILTVDSKGNVSKKKNSMNPQSKTTAILVGKGYVDDNHYAQGIMDIDIYPHATSAVYACSEESEGAAISGINSPKIGNRTRLYPYSMPEDACQDFYTYSTTNANVATVYTDGTVEATGNGTAYIYVKAGDGTGKKTKIKITVAHEKATSVAVYDDLEAETLLDKVYLSSIEMGDKRKSFLIAADNVKAIPETSNQAFNVSTSNKKIAKVEKEYDKSGELKGYRITAVAKGNADIKFIAADGSKKSYTVKVNVTTPVNQINILSSTGSFILKPGKSLKLKANTNNASNKAVTWRFLNPEVMGEYATLNESTGAVIAKRNTDIVYDEEHMVSVYAVANDYGGFVSWPVNIVISPSKVLMKNIRVNASDERDYMSAGTNLQMVASTTRDATNRKIKWAIEDVNEDIKGRVSITSSGLLKTNSSITSRSEVTVTATALDGSGVIGKRKIIIYPKLSSITITSVAEGYEGLETDNHYVAVGGDDLSLFVRGKNNSIDTSEETKPLQKFYITYKCTKGQGKVYLKNSEGTEVFVRGLSKGTLYVYATAMDGSGKKATYKVTMQ